MSIFRNLSATFIAISMIAVTSCVPKATEKKAACGTNEAFSSVTRSCYSIEEVRLRPVGTTSSAALSEETPKSIELLYTDGNKDKAISCKITSFSANLEVVSNNIVDGSLFIKADEATYAASELQLLLTPGDNSKVVSRALLLNTAKDSQYYPTVSTKLGVLKLELDATLAEAEAITGDAAITYSSKILKEKLVALNPFLIALENRCECAAGKCYATLIPKANKSGAANFIFTIADQDGTSPEKTVAVTIAAMAKTTPHLAPVVMSGIVTGEESNTSVASPFSFTLPVAADLSGAAPETFTYHYTGTTNGGSVSDCMGLNGSTNYDRICNYKPSNGNAVNETTLVAASATLDDIVFTSRAAGIAGNDLKVQIYNIRADNSLVDTYVSRPATFGLVNPAYNESLIRVVGNNVRIFINEGVTTTTDIIDLVNNHPQAKILMSASLKALPAGTLPVVRPLTSLTGGVGAYDSIRYYVKNVAGVSSTNTASIAVRITDNDDLPVLLPTLATTTVLEDGGQITLDLKPFFTDNDSNGTTKINVCSANFMYDSLFFAAAFPPGVTNPLLPHSIIDQVNCTVSLRAIPFVSSGVHTYDFSFTVGSHSTITGITQWLTDTKIFRVTITPVNNVPQVSINILTMLPHIQVTTVPDVAEGSSGFVDVYMGPGGGGYETTQTTTLTVTSSDQALLPNSAITVTASPTAGATRISYTPVANRSGTVNLTYQATDSLGAVSVAQIFPLVVTMVNNPPVFFANTSPYGSTTTMPNVETNEGGAVQSVGFTVDEDSGNSPDENAQGIKISILSDDNTVLPTDSLGAITLFYDLNDNGVEDVGENRVATVVGGALEFVDVEITKAADAKAHKFYLKIDPVDGVAGNANIAVTATDETIAPDVTPPRSTTANFSFIVHAIAAQHGGWDKISSVGIKKDKSVKAIKVITNSSNILTEESEILCNHNKSTEANKCSTGDCIGSSPNGTIVPNAANVVYWDRDNKRCYRSNSNSEYSWVEFNTTCPIDRTNVCASSSCIYNTGVLPTGTHKPNRAGEFSYNTANNKCYVSTGKLTVNDWEEFSPSKVTLGWKTFNVVSSGVTVNTVGYNVYRREAGVDYNFKDGYVRNKSTDTMSVADANIMEFVDKTAIAGKVYYYVVRPVIRRQIPSGVPAAYSDFPTHTPESFSEVRVLAAPANYSYVHRWMVNQEICNSMHMTTTTSPNAVDQSNNYRCPYTGPGEAIDDNGTPVNLADDIRTGYFDYGKDLLVNTQELGCPYSPAPSCTANGCVGLATSAPTFNMAAGNHVYYSRANGLCYTNTGGSTWTEMEGTATAVITAISASLNTSLNAPLVNLTQAKAKVICEQTPAPVVSGMTISSASRLPNKLDFNAYAAHKSNVDDNTLMETEQGFSMNLYSRCNGSSASGLESAYSDSAIPSTSLIYSLPGTQSSGIKSIYTGSIPWTNNKGTEECVSRYGIQDVYGNVSEWTQDQMTCSNSIAGTSVCSVDVTIPNGSFKSADFGTRTSAPLNPINYGFDEVTGPFNELNGDGIPSVTAAPVSYDGYMGKWTYSTITYNATKFSFPVAMPIHGDIINPALQVDLDVLSFILNIGPSNGIKTDKLYEDGMIVNNKLMNDLITSGSTMRGSFAVGGSYLSGNLAGRYSTELIPQTIRGPDVGLRCIVPISKDDYPNDLVHDVYAY